MTNPLSASSGIKQAFCNNKFSDYLNSLSSIFKDIANSTEAFSLSEDINSIEFHSLLMSCYGSFTDFSESTSLEEELNKKITRIGRLE